MRTKSELQWFVAVTLMSLSGCSELFKDDSIDIRLPDIRVDIADVVVDPTSGKGVGVACDAAAVVPECRFGLSCSDSVCRTTGDSPQNRPCILTSECGGGLYCGLVGACQPVGSGVAGSACSTAGDCDKGLVCRSLGFGGACVAGGTGDLEAPCAGVEDCQAGLSCGGEGVCAAGSPVFGLRPWQGVTCADVSATAAPVIHFEVPRSGAAVVEDGDFFRLPFPNDIRMKGGPTGTLDLSGFPTPGPGIVGFDPVLRIIDAAEKVQQGFSTEPVVTFRLSHGFKLETIRAADDALAGPATLYFRNIDKDSPQYGWTPDFSYFVTDGGSKYICPRYVSVRPTWNLPLQPGTTYAVIMANGVQTSDASPFQADADMSAMLSPTAPSEPDLLAAWKAYAPLRDYVADPTAAIPVNRVIAAAVFTTQRVDGVLPAVRAAIHAGPMPAPVGLIECKAGVTSPCDDGLSGDDRVRGCFSESALVHELHMKVPLPKVQAGTRPYLAPADGGDLVFDGAGKPVLQGTEEVCVSLTIPKGQTMPAGGWPVALYGHGTGGSFRSAVSDAGEALAAIDLGAGTMVGVAAVGWDGPMHGARSGSALDPGVLFYNLANPVAARGNLLQGAADVFALVRALKAWTIDAAASPTGSEIRFDPLKIILVGHSQGATTGPLASPYEPDVRNVVWSGAGGGLVLSLLNKTKPVDAALAGAVALQELDNGVPVPLNDLHPALALVQGLFDAVDPLNHGRFATVDRALENPIQHVLMTYGVGDSYTPNATGRAFARALRVQPVTPLFEDFGPAFVAVDAPQKENLVVPGGKATAVLLQARPDGYDGHFVLFRDATLQRRYQQWVGTFVRDGVPTLVP